jgi:DNA-binding response OmpR family regulator
VTVYLVDDDSEEAELFQDAMSQIDIAIKVFWYDNVMDAMDALMGEKKMPEFLFLDLNLPKVSGKDMLRLLRQNEITSVLPIVIYSTSISKMDIEDITPYNVSRFLQKPEDFNSLCRELGNVVLNS